MRYYYEKPSIYLSMYGTIYFCDHPVYDRCTLFEIQEKGMAVIFAGGRTKSSVSNIVNAYNASLTRTSATTLSVARSLLSSTSIGEYALFAGGQTTSAQSTVDSYNGSLTKGSQDSLLFSAFLMGATSVGDYALFAGGEISSVTNRVYAYNKTLTRTSPTVLSTSRSKISATTVGGYALFAGGTTKSGTGNSTDVVDSYSTSLSRGTPTALSYPTYETQATTIGDFAIFELYQKTYANVYDKNLVRTILTTPNTCNGNNAAASVGSYALFAGGYPYSDIVNVYSI